MPENVRLDFEKYYGTFVSTYQKFYTKRLLMGLIGLVVVVGLVLALPSIWLQGFVALAFLPLLAYWFYQNGQAYRQVADYLAQQLAFWEEALPNFDPQAPATLVYEDPDNYYVQEGGEFLRFSKKGSRTLPAAQRGLSLIVAENSDLFSQRRPLLLSYCDVAEIKYLNLAKMNEKILREMRLTRLKNKLVPPLMIIVILICLWFYFF